MLKQLIKIRLAGLLSSLSKGISKNKKGKQTGKVVLLIILYLYMMLVFGFMLGSFFYVLADLQAVGSGWLYFAFYAILGFTLMLMGSSTMAKNQIFDAKDNDLLLSMPIPPSYIITSRVMMLVITNLIYLLVVFLPVAIVWGVKVGFSIMGFISFILLTAGLLLLSTALGVFMGWLIALCSKKAKNKTLVTVLFTAAFLCVYFYFCFSIQNYLSVILENAALIAGSLKKVLPLYWFGSAISEGNILYTLVSAAICVVPFVIAFYILSKTFNKIVSASKSTTRIKEKKADFNAVAPKKALIKREISHTLASATYLLNSGLGVVMGIIAAVLIIIKRNSIMVFLTGTELPAHYMAVLMLFAAIFLIGMIYFSSASISIEGKSLWILRSLPMSSKDILMSKIKFHFFAALPVSCAMWIAINVCFYVNWAFLIYSALILLVYSYLTACIGLMENLKHPNLDWQDESQAVKTGFSVMFTMLINMVITFLPLILVLVFTFIDLWVTLAVWLTVVAAFAYFCHYRIMTNGVKLFERL